MYFYPSRGSFRTDIATRAAPSHRITITPSVSCCTPCTPVAGPAAFVPGQVGSRRDFSNRQYIYWDGKCSITRLMIALGTQLLSMQALSLYYTALTNWCLSLYHFMILAFISHSLLLLFIMKSLSLYNSIPSVEVKAFFFPAHVSSMSTKCHIITEIMLAEWLNVQKRGNSHLTSHVTRCLAKWHECSRRNFLQNQT